LVLCDSTDAPARWALEGLRRSGLEPVELVTSDDLAHARWVHSVGPRGARVELQLCDGRAFRGDSVRGALNRLVSPPQGSLLLIHPSDRSYVAQELMAFFMSWLQALAGPVLNRPTPESLCGRVRSLAEWLWLAGRAGLPTPSYRLSSEDSPAQPSLHVRMPDPAPDLRTLLVVGDRVVGAPAPAAISEGCRRLGTLARTALLGLEFSVDPRGGWRIAGATCLPDLRLGGQALLDALARSLRDGRGSGE
jgi:hypothetical protein